MLEDLDRVAAIHCTAFPDSLLSGLGRAAVRRYYHWLFTGPHDVTALGIRRDGDLAGFIIGGVFRGALMGFVKKNCIPLAWSLFVHPRLLVKQTNRHRLLAGVRTAVPFLRCESKVRKQSAPKKAIGIMAIAVNPNYARSGYGRRLMEAFERIARDRKFARMQLRVNPLNKAAIDFYQELGWSKLDEPWTGVMWKPVSGDR
jgi:ribosomal protein S18 acetylase RimI-like enzyme